MLVRVFMAKYNTIQIILGLHRLQFLPSQTYLHSSYRSKLIKFVVAC